MVHDSIRNLRMDRRVLSRRGWISEDDLGKELAALPDVGDKAELVRADEPTEAAGAAEKD